MLQFHLLAIYLFPIVSSKKEESKDFFRSAFLKYYLQYFMVDLVLMTHQLSPHKNLELVI